MRVNLIESRRRDPNAEDELFFSALAAVRRFATPLSLAIAASFPCAAQAFDEQHAYDAARLHFEIERDKTPDFWTAAVRDTWDWTEWLPVPGVLKMMRGGGRLILITSSANSLNVNLRTLTTSHPNYAANIRLTVIWTINANVYVGSTTDDVGGTSTGTGWATGDTIHIINNGYLVGNGGGGGFGGLTNNFPGYPGMFGGNGDPGRAAINLFWPVVIDNTNGYIFGGSGGSAGGSSAISQNELYRAPGGGGAGGRGYPGGSGGSAGGLGAGNGGNGNTNGIAAGGGGGSDGGIVIGGDGGGFPSAAQGWASSGANGGWGSNGVQTGSPGGPGRAVKLNGYAVTWLGGNNATQIKGAIS
jgi:hypothetical protein